MYQLENIYWLLENNIKKICTKCDLDSKLIIIFGASTISERCVNILKKMNYEASYIFDNDKKKIEMISNGELPPFAGSYHLSLPSKSSNYPNAIILVGVRDYHGACTQLQQLGYDISTQVFNLIDYSDIVCDEHNYLNSDEIRFYQLNLLNFLDQLSKQNGYKYYLCGGTLLGSIRHKGYIPWDDDIDIFMPTKDLDALCKYLGNNDCYETLNFANQGVPYLCTKLVDKRTSLQEIHFPFVIHSGISIDLFPISGIPSNENELAKYKKEILLFRKEYDNLFQREDDINQQNISSIQEMYKTLCNRYDLDDCEYAGYTITGRFDKEMLPKSCFSSSIMTEFEGRFYPTFCGYKTYLKQFYGDYMTLPPSDQRKSKHNLKAWLRNA